MPNKWSKDELDFLKNSLNWPKWPVMPIVRREYDPLAKDACGYVLANDPSIVYLGNIWNLPPAGLTCAPKIEYDSIEKLLDEWRLD